MVKTPRTHHSRKKREPVTIDLEAEAIRREESEADNSEKETAESALPHGSQEADLPPASTEAASAAMAADAPERDVAEENAPAEPNEASGQQSDNGEGAEAAPEPISADSSSNRSVGRGLLAGVAGGVIALALAGGLQWANVLPAPGEADTDPALESVRQELATVQSELAEMRQAGTADVPGAAIDQALAEPRQRIDEVGTQVAELRESISALQTATSSAEGADLQPLEQRLSELESRISSLAETAGTAGGAEELAGRVADAEQRIEGAAQAADSAQQVATANEQRLEELAERIGQVEGQMAEQDEGPRLALIVAASALRSAVERGAPFESELETYTALAPDAQELEPLRQYAQTGIPTQAELAEEAPEAASRIVASTSSLPPDAGFLDRLMSSARSAVTVRPVGEVEGDTPEAIAARMEAAIERGEYARALAEYDTLPPAAKEAASDLAEKLRARQAADEVLERALSGALQPA